VSGIGPASHVVNAGDLNAVTTGNGQVCRRHIPGILPASNVDTRSTEGNNIETWAKTSNLALNRTKSKEIIRFVIVTKLLYASSASQSPPALWGRFIKLADRQRVDAFLVSSKSCGNCPPDLTSFGELCKKSDEQLFQQITSNRNHIALALFTPQTVASQNYNLRTRTHNRQLPKYSGHL